MRAECSPVSRYIYRIVIGCDGNHSLHKKAKREDPNDVSLAASQGYFVNHKDMATYLEKSYENEDTVRESLLLDCHASLTDNPIATNMQRLSSP